jgi:nitrogen fixation/metabolism regulation signal transduction histidine kinase
MWYPYHQVEKYFTGQIPGMGLGLSVVAALIWSVGGSCQAYNRPEGPGVIIELVLPRK